MFNRFIGSGHGYAGGLGGNGLPQPLSLFDSIIAAADGQQNHARWPTEVPVAGCPRPVPTDPFQEMNLAMINPRILSPAARIPGLVLALIAGFAFVQPAAAQSTRDLRDENQRLTTQVDDLQKELTAAKQRIAELERQLSDLRQNAATRGGPASTGRSSAPDPKPKVTIDESDPFASPRALFNAVVENHGDAMRDQPVGREGRSERELYLRKLQEWRGGALRKFNGTIDWTVRLLHPNRDLADGRRLELIAVDPVTEAQLGDPFFVALDRAQLERLQKIHDRRLNEDDDQLGVLMLHGVAEPQIDIDPARLEPRKFTNVHAFIGPFAEYMLKVTPRSLVPVREEAPAATPADTPPQDKVDPSPTGPQHRQDK